MAEPRGAALTDVHGVIAGVAPGEGAAQTAQASGTGGLTEMEQLLAFCDWERQHNPHPEGRMHVAQWAYNEIVRLRAALAASEAQAEPVAFFARPLEWDMDHPGQWTDKHHGFCIIYEQSEDKPYGASWGEGDVEDFAELDAAKAWCQQQLDAWVRRYVVAHRPAAQAEPVAWVGPVLQLMPNVIYQAWAAKHPEEAAHFRPLVHPSAPQQPAQPEPSALLEWAVLRWHEDVKNRPLVNVYRAGMDKAWRRVIRYAGGDPEALIGPRQPTPQAAPQQPAPAERGDVVALPQNAAQAEAMVKVGVEWLRQRAPERLTPAERGERAAQGVGNADKLLQDFARACAFGDTDSRRKAGDALHAALASTPRVPRHVAVAAQAVRKQLAEAFPREELDLDAVRMLADALAAAPQHEGGA